MEQKVFIQHEQRTTTVCIIPFIITFFFRFQFDNNFGCPWQTFLGKKSGTTTLHQTVSPPWKIKETRFLASLCLLSCAAISALDAEKTHLTKWHLEVSGWLKETRWIWGKYTKSAERGDIRPSVFLLANDRGQEQFMNVNESHKISQ